MPQQPGFMPPRVQVFIKNIDVAPYVISELNITLAPNVEVDIADPAAEHHYADSSTAWRAINELPRASLYIGVHSTPPKLEARFVPLPG